MDATFIVPFTPDLSQSSTIQHPELTKIFETFFGVARSGKVYFNVEMYQARLRLTIDMLLLEADDRATAAGKKAHVYVVGLGLGVWQVHSSQAQWYIETFTDAVEDHELLAIGTIEFAWINNVPQETQTEVIDAAREQDINVIFSKRNPAEKLKTDELLVLSYAWDGNAFPGNEYWAGSLAGSGDPAAACMSTIGELHNPLVNPFTERICKVGQGLA